MSVVGRIIREDVQSLSAYHVADSGGFLKLDAMENPYTLGPELSAELAGILSKTALNRYPVPTYTELKRKICEKNGVPKGFDVLLGNGSDELISLVSVACAKPGGLLLTPSPGFVMYEMFAKFAGLAFKSVDLRADFTLDTPAMLEAIEKYRPTVVFLAMPHNPTGTLFPREDVIAILDAMKDKGLVISDEAYEPFAEATCMDMLPEYPHLAVMRTVSKLGLAGIRLGYMSASAELLEAFDKIRPPYNVNVLTEATASFAMDHIGVFREQAAVIRAEREKLAVSLSSLEGFQVFPSRANFLLVRTKGAAQIFARLKERKVLIKNLAAGHPLLADCLRITVGSPEENALLIERLKACL